MEFGTVGATGKVVKIGVLYLAQEWQFGQYALACSLSIVLQIVFANLLAPHFFYQIANLIAIGVTSVLNFLLNDIWTFGRARLLSASKKVLR